MLKVFKALLTRHSLQEEGQAGKSQLLDKSTGMQLVGTSPRPILLQLLNMSQNGSSRNLVLLSLLGRWEIMTIYFVN